MPSKSASASTKDVARPPDPSHVKTAAALAARYEISVERNGEHGYVGTVAEVPKVFGCGHGVDECRSATRELLTWALVYLIEEGRTIPSPAAKA